MVAAAGVERGHDGPAAVDARRAGRRAADEGHRLPPATAASSVRRDGAAATRGRVGLVVRVALVVGVRLVVRAHHQHVVEGKVLDILQVGGHRADVLQQDPPVGRRRRGAGPGSEVDPDDLARGLVGEEAVGAGPLDGSQTVRDEITRSFTRITSVRLRLTVIVQPSRPAVLSRTPISCSSCSPRESSARGPTYTVVCGEIPLTVSAVLGSSTRPLIRSSSRRGGTRGSKSAGRAGVRGSRRRDSGAGSTGCSFARSRTGGSRSAVGSHRSTARPRQGRAGTTVVTTPARRW